MEEYKNIDECYEISNYGNCRRLLKNGDYRVIKGSIQNRGYRYYQIQINGVRINKLFHQLVAQAFLGDRPEGLVIDHIDRNKLNNNVSNLRYITFKENLRNCDRYRDDIKAVGKERTNILSNDRHNKNRKNKTYICETCPLLVKNKRGSGIFCCKRDYNEHMKSKLHIKRVKIIEQMRIQNIDVNCLEYNRIKDQNADYKRKRRKTKPIIDFNTF